ncbi:hypothetical protein CJF31_00009014 [Rutstroemia sp. NJR-2017a BVV2]|nr:hypothetical protein CJF31_00009014 [Rutstroemia sp. NJR-2017a BVV2]
MAYSPNSTISVFLFIQLFLLIPLVHSFPFSISSVRHKFETTPSKAKKRDLSAVLGELGTLGGDLTSASTLSTFLGDRRNVVTQNDLLDKNGSCATMMVVFARGTGEPDNWIGNVGILTGPPFFTALAAYMNGTGNLMIQGVDYDASINGFLDGGDKKGAATMATLINSTLHHCPRTHLLLSGYSQGAQLVHKATASLPTTTTSKINSIILFGDPMNGTAINGVDPKRVMTFCDPADDICKGGDVVTKAHLEYVRDVGVAAGFAVAGVAEMGISSLRRGAMGGLGG